MNNKKNYTIKIIVFFAIILLPMAASVLFAQPGPPPPPPPPPGVPIDGGIALLLAGLGAYGAKKLSNKKK